MGVCFLGVPAGQPTLRSSGGCQGGDRAGAEKRPGLRGAKFPGLTHRIRLGFRPTLSGQIQAGTQSRTVLDTDLFQGWIIDPPEMGCLPVRPLAVAQGIPGGPEQVHLLGGFVVGEPKPHLGLRRDPPPWCSPGIGGACGLQARIARPAWRGRSTSSWIGHRHWAAPNPAKCGVPGVSPDGHAGQSTW
jgi:hypothetical protein